jgi:GNAT superfamily N-acetyltransferase
MINLKVSFRKAQNSDSISIQNFQQAMAWETENLRLDPSTLEKGVTAVLKNSALGTYHVCETNSEVIGSLLLTQEWSDWRNGTVWWLHSLYFKPEFRGQGLFSQMYHYVQQLAKNEKDVCGIRQYVDHTNLHAQKVYTKLGMNGDHYRLFEWMNGSFKA